MWIADAVGIIFCFNRQEEWQATSVDNQGGRTHTTESLQNMHLSKGGIEEWRKGSANYMTMKWRRRRKEKVFAIRAGNNGQVATKVQQEPLDVSPCPIVCATDGRIFFFLCILIVYIKRAVFSPVWASFSQRAPLSALKFEKGERPTISPTSSSHHQQHSPTLSWMCIDHGDRAVFLNNCCQSSILLSRLLVTSHLFFPTIFW